jgi:hypothetical protein
MQGSDFSSIAHNFLDSLLTFGAFLSKTYGTGNVARDGVAAFALIISLFAILGLVKYLTKQTTGDPEFDEATSVISEALELTSIQITELRYQLFTEFDRSKQELESLRRQRAA